MTAKRGRPAKVTRPVVASELPDTLPITPVKDNALTKEELLRLLEDARNANELAQVTIDQQANEIKEQVQMYNRDMEYMHNLSSNTIKYSKAKEDAVNKILSGVLEFTALDRMELAPRKESK